MVRTRRAAKLEEATNAADTERMAGAETTSMGVPNNTNNHSTSVSSVHVQEASAGGIGAQLLDLAARLDSTNALPPRHHSEDDGEIQYPAAPPPSPASTEINVEPPREEVPFDRTVSPGVVARDYAFHPSPLRPATHVFPILTTYIVFQYVRNLVRNLKPHSILLNGDQSVFFGLDLVYLIHFNWITVKDICWPDARDWLGWSLIWLYNNPRGPAEITYGAKRPSPKSPQVTKWFSRFAKMRALKWRTLPKTTPRRQLEYNAAELRRYGPFGEGIFSFFPYEERVVYWPLYEYLNGRGPRPMMSSLMERVFEPILNCHGGGIGGHGVPYERPRAEGVTGPLEGTEVEEVDIDPDLVAIGTTPVPVFALWLMGDMEDGFGKQLELVQAQAGRAKKNNGRPREKTSDATDVRHEVIEIPDDEDKSSRRVTRSMARKANIPQQIDAAPNVQAPTSSRGNKGKQKARTLPTTDDIENGVKRYRGEDEDFDIDEVEFVSTDPGPSSRPARGVRRKLAPISESEDPAVNVQNVQLSGHGTTGESTTGRKRRRVNGDDTDVGGLGCSNPGHSTRTTSRVRRRVETPPTLHQPSQTLEHSAHSSWETSEPRGTKRKRSLAPEPSDGAIDACRKRLRLETPPPMTEDTELASGFSDMVRSPVIGTTTGKQTLASEIPVSSSAADVPVQNDAPSPVETNSGDTGEDEPSSVAVAAEPISPGVPQQQQVQNPGPLQHQPLRRTETTLLFGELTRPGW